MDHHGLPPNTTHPELTRLAQKAYHLQRLLASSADCIVVMNAEGAITDWNAAAERVLGWTAEEAIGANLGSLIVPPEHRAAHHTGLQRFLVTRSSAMFNKPLEVQALRKDGSRLSVELTVWPIDEGAAPSFGAFLRDISDRKAHQHALAQAAQRYREVVENLGEGMGIIQDGLTVYVNPRAAEMLGRQPDAMLGCSFLDWVHPDDHAMVADRHVRRQRGEAVPERYELRCVKGNGEVRWMSTRASALQWEGRAATMTFFTDVTEQRQMLDALHRSEERYRAVVEHVGDGMVVVQGERFVFANQRAAEIVEMSVDDMLSHGYLHRIHPDDHAIVQDRRRRRLEGLSVPNRYEIRLRMPDGRVKWLDIGVTLVPWDNGVSTLTFFSDVSERKLLEEKLTHTLAERETILNTSVVGIAFLTAQGRFRWANPAMLHLFGASADGSFNSMELVYLSRAQYLQVGDAVARAIARGERYQTEIQMKRLDGQLIWVTLSGQAVNLAELSAGTVWTVLDITQRKQAEEDIRTALQQQQELNELRSRFVSMTSHEFRTPLATILSSAELLKFYGDRMPAAERMEVIDSIEASVQRMTQMLDRVLMLGRSEAGMLEFKPQWQDLAALCQQLTEEASRHHANTQHRVVLNLSAPALPGWFDDKLLRHALGNLLSNALKYSPQGGVVGLDVVHTASHVHLSVSDQGIGIPATEIPHLFTSFHRASNVGDIKGTGLGLAIVKNATELHGGTLSVDSEVNRGTRFSLQLPWDQDPRPVSERESS